MVEYSLLMVEYSLLSLTFFVYWRRREVEGRTQQNCSDCDRNPVVVVVNGEVVFELCSDLQKNMES